MASNNDEIVTRPSHYTAYDIEPVEFCIRNNLDFATGNIVKYALRRGKKTYEGKTPNESAIIDLQKVQRYAQMLINHYEGKGVL